MARLRSVAGKSLHDSTQRLAYYYRMASLTARFACDRVRYRHRRVTLDVSAQPSKWISKGAASEVPIRKIPRVVWMYWHREERPRIVDIAVNQVRIENPGYEVRVLSRSTIQDWLPTFEVEAEAISVQHFTDLLRLELLRVYGGIWVDASMVVRASFDDLFDGEVEAPSAGYDLFAFYIDGFSSNPDRPIIENWFLAAPPDNELIIAWQRALEPMRLGGEVAMSKVLKALPDYEALKQDMLLEEYLVSHIALQHVLGQSERYSIRLQRAEDEAFRLQTLCRWDHYRLMVELLAKPFEDESPLRVVKLTGYERDLADFLLRRRLAHPRNLLGRSASSG